MIPDPPSPRAARHPLPAGGARPHWWTRRKGLFCCLGFLFPLVWMWPFMYYGWKAADRLFRPRNPTVESSGGLDLLQTVRAVAGFTVLAGVAAYYGDADALDAMTSGRNLLKSIGAGLAALIAVLVFFVVRARPEARGEMMGRFVRYPLVSVVVFALAYLVLLAAASTTEWLRFGSDTWYLVPVSIIAMISGGGFIVGFVFWSLFLTAKNVFNAADVHPLLPCVCTPVASLSLAAAGLAQSDGPTPTWLGVALTVSGVVTATAVSAAEWYHLRSRHGVSIRMGPHPPGPGTA